MCVCNLSVCRTVTSELCVTGPWVWNRGIIGNSVHFQNCIPMYGDGGRDIYDLRSNPNATQGIDYDWYCPVALERLETDPLQHGMINQNTERYFDNLQMCINLDVDTHCKSFATLEEKLSPRLEEGKIEYMS